MLIAILAISIIFLALAYRLMGNFLCRHCQVDDSRKTPAETNYDGVDYVPTRTSILFGHHFSSIAGAGPIVGPVLATMYFGWGPTWLWIVIGAIFFGGVHDFGSILMSLRYRGRTITEITNSLVGQRTAMFFRLFLVLALFYVIIVFLDLTASTFVAAPAVATASGWFILCAVVFGLALRWKGLPWPVTLAIFIPLTFVGLWLGHEFPAIIPEDFLGPVSAKSFWLLLIGIYCFSAAVLPVNILLQPRDFLSSIFLYAMMLVGILGLLFSGETLRAPIFSGFNTGMADPGYIFPVLFITVACGACSGFHSLVASGTTSKQIARESDAKPVAYGAMLLEALLAIFAMASVAIISQGDVQGKDPVQIFSIGAAVFMSALHIPEAYGREFTALTVSTFLLTTLDTCARLTRFMLSEMFKWEGASVRYLGTLIVVLVPSLISLQTFDGQPAWKALWPLFGATNQMMAGLALVTFVVFLKDRRLGYRFAMFPAMLMMLTPLTALVFMAMKFSPDNWFLPLISMGMFVLGISVAGMSLKFVFEVDSMKIVEPSK